MSISLVQGIARMLKQEIIMYIKLRAIVVTCIGINCINLFCKSWI